jgi:hypothetical protein
MNSSNQNKSDKEIVSFKDLLSTIFHSSGCITFVIVVSALVVGLLLGHYLTPESTHTWSGYYCHPNGCQAGNAAPSSSLNIEEGETPACPETYQVKRGAVLVLSVAVPVYDNYELVPGTCEIHAIGEK